MKKFLPFFAFLVKKFLSFIVYIKEETSQAVRNEKTPRGRLWALERKAFFYVEI